MNPVVLPEVPVHLRAGTGSRDLTPSRSGADGSVRGPGTAVDTLPGGSGSGSRSARRGTAWLLAAVALAAMLTGAPLRASAMPVTLHFDLAEIGEATPVSVDDLEVMGVSFDYKIAGIDSTAAVYGVASPDDAATESLAGRSLEGDRAGILTLLFAQPTTVLSFAVALNTIGTVAPGFTVDLFAPDDSPLGSTPVVTGTQPGRIWSEGVFDHDGAALARAVITFDDTVDPDPFIRTFWLDNLSYEAVPEPSSLLLAVLGLASLEVLRRRGGASR